MTTTLVHNVDAARATQMTESGATLLDDREDHEWSPGTPLAPFTSPWASSISLRFVSTDLTIIAMCRSGNR